MEKLRKAFRRAGQGALRKRLASVVVLVFMLGLALASVPAERADAAIGQSDVVDTSFYTMSSAAAGYLSDCMANRTVPNPNPWSNNVGGLLGYCDEANTSGVITDWVQSAISSSSATYSYMALERMDVIAGQSAFMNYANYGRALHQLGIDSTGTETGSIIRGLAGGLMKGFYLLSCIVNIIFMVVLNFLVKINPFRLFGIRATQDGTLLNVPIGKSIEEFETGMNGSNQTFGGYVSGLYAFLTDSIGWQIVIPVCVVALLITLFLTKKEKGYEIRKFLWRIGLMCFAVPLMGSLYTECLWWMQQQLDVSKGTPSTKVVASIFCDFEGWASGTCLQDPGFFSSVLAPSASGSRMINWNEAGVVDAASVLNIRNIVLAINQMSAGLDSSGNVVLGGLTTGASNQTEWDSEVGKLSGGDATNSALSYVCSLLDRYSDGTFYSASDYESYWKAGQAIDVIESVAKKTNSLLEWKNGNAADVFCNSDLWGRGNDYVYNSGMSPMSMYNYLSTRFTLSGITVYSNEKASSGFVRQNHYAVNLVGGGGIISFLLYLNGLLLLGCFVILALWYGMGMIVGSMMRTFKVITSIPMAAMGSLRFGAKLVGNTLMMVVEVVISMLMYTVCVTLLYGSGELVTAMFMNVANALGFLGVISGAPLLIIQLLLSSIFYLFLTVYLLKYRKTAVRAMDEFIADFVNRVIPGARDSDMIKPRGKGLLPAAMGAAGTAAGAIAANKLLNRDPKASGDGVSGESSDASGNGGDGNGGGNGPGTAVADPKETATADGKETEDGAGGKGFDNSDNADNEAGREAMAGDGLDSGNGIEQPVEANGDSGSEADGGERPETGMGNPEAVDDGSGMDAETEYGQESGDDAGDADGARDASGVAVGDEADAGEGRFSGGRTGGQDTPGSGQQGSKGSEGAKREAKAQADYDKSEKQRKALEKAAGMTAAQASAQSGSSMGKGLTGKQAQDGYANALSGKSGGTRAVKASEDKPAGNGAKAAERSKGSNLTAAERAAADAAEADMKAGLTVPKGPEAMTYDEANAVADATVQAAQDAAKQTGATLTKEDIAGIRADASAMAAGAAKNASEKAIASDAALSAAAATKGVGRSELSPKDVATAQQAAETVRASAARATSADGLAKSVALSAAKAANGGKPLTATQQKAVEKAAAQASANVQNAAVAAAQATKGGPLSRQEMDAVSRNAGEMAAQQAAVDAVEQAMGMPLSDTQREAVMGAASEQVAGIYADNTRARIAERSAVESAKAVSRSNGMAQPDGRALRQTGLDARRTAEATMAAANPANMAARSAVGAANRVYASKGRRMSQAQRSDTVRKARQSQALQRAYEGGYPEGTTQARMASNLRQQDLANRAQSMARQASQDRDAGTQALQSAASGNWAAVEALKAQLSAQGYTAQEINNIANGKPAGGTRQAFRDAAGKAARDPSVQAGMFAGAADFASRSGNEAMRNAGRGASRAQAAHTANGFAEAAQRRRDSNKGKTRPTRQGGRRKTLKADHDNSWL